MGMQLNILDTDDLSAQDRSILAILSKSASETSAAPAAKKAAPAKKAAAPKPADEPEPDVEVEEDLVGSDAPTMADAVARATELVGKGKQKEVKAVLADLEAPKVSALKGDQIGEFLTALADVDA